jgi:hypothetical protein
MDTSKKYAKMCEMAEEIQKLRSMEPGLLNFIRLGARRKGMVLNDVWLPRQDQLQAMIQKCQGVSFDPPYSQIDQLIDAFTSWRHKHIQPGISDNSITMEQLWLMFVMDMKYMKKWNGEAWVKFTP